MLESPRHGRLLANRYVRSLLGSEGGQTLRLRSWFVFAFAGLLLGCADTGGKITTTRSPDAKQIPSNIGVYPLLTAESKRERGLVPVPQALGTEVREDRIYIQPPAEAKLVVTLQSQRMSDLLAAELSYRGFGMKQLPVGVPEDHYGEGKGNSSFFISLELLNHLRAEYGLQAVLMGNVYFVVDRYAPTEPRIKAAYLKLVDIESLDVLCHVSVAHDDDGSDMERTIQEIAIELARMANLPPQ